MGIPQWIGHPDMGHIYTWSQLGTRAWSKSGKKFIPSMIGYNIVHMEKSHIFSWRYTIIFLYIWFHMIFTISSTTISDENCTFRLPGRFHQLPSPPQKTGQVGTKICSKCFHNQFMEYQELCMCVVPIFCQKKNALNIVWIRVYQCLNLHNTTFPMPDWYSWKSCAQIQRSGNSRNFICFSRSSILQSGTTHHLKVHKTRILQGG